MVRKAREALNRSGLDSLTGSIGGALTGPSHSNQPGKRTGPCLRESPQTAYDLQKKARERPEMSNKVYHSGVGSGCRTLALGLRSRIDIKPAIHMKLRHSFRPVKSQRVGPIHPYLLYGLS
jgi:hypothetical protein